jgi:hypothetical protein
MTPQEIFLLGIATGIAISFVSLCFILKTK